MSSAEHGAEPEVLEPHDRVHLLRRQPLQLLLLVVLELNQ
jgi:hypothetical protein